MIIVNGTALVQLDEKIESSNYSRLLCVCPGIDINDGKTYEYQPLTEHFSDIAVSDLEKLDFELRDDKALFWKWTLEQQLI